MQILNRYIRTNVVMATLLVVFILTGIDAFMLFFAQTTDVGKGDYTMFKAVLYLLMQLPFDIYQYFPMAGFLGCLIGLGRLARTSELVVMRASGISIAGITFSVIKAAILMVVVMVIIGELISPILQFQSEQMKAYALGKEMEYSTLGWLRDQDRFIYIGKIVNPKKMRDITIFEIKNHRIRSNSYAPVALKQKTGVWQMQDVVQTVFESKRAFKKIFPTLDLNIKFDPVSVTLREKSIEELSVVGLYQMVRYREEVGLDVRQYLYAFWQRVFQPFVTIVMICLGIPFIFVSLRTANLGLKVLTGIIIGFAFYTINQVVGPLSIVYQIPLILGAIIPLVISVAACVMLFRKI